MRRLALLSIIASIGASPVEAHCYRVWHYLKPQRCFTAFAPLPPLTKPTFPPVRIEIPLPSLEDIDWGQEGDERLRGIAKLREIGDGLRP
jgi:hypothetical protein